jgi:hypothetical protein
MKVTISKKIGKSTLQFQVEGEKEKDSLAKASYFTTIPDVCGNCQSENISLDSNRTEEFLFIKIKCLDCNFRSNMGELKAGGIFWKQWEEYVAPLKQKTDESFKKSAKKEEEEDLF